jgi:hypothetical protein
VPRVRRDRVLSEATDLHALWSGRRRGDVRAQGGKITDWDVPGAVVRSFSGRGTTVQRIHSPSAARMTELLWNQATDPSATAPSISAEEILRDLMSPLDVEDIVLMYIQYRDGF